VAESWTQSAVFNSRFFTHDAGWKGEKIASFKLVPRGDAIRLSSGEIERGSASARRMIEIAINVAAHLMKRRIGL
jgi:hypothetical protein